MAKLLLFWLTWLFTFVSAFLTSLLLIFSLLSLNLLFGSQGKPRNLNNFYKQEVRVTGTCPPEGLTGPCSFWRGMVFIQEVNLPTHTSGGAERKRNKQILLECWDIVWDTVFSYWGKVMVKSIFYINIIGVLFMLSLWNHVLSLFLYNYSCKEKKVGKTSLGKRRV